MKGISIEKKEFIVSVDEVFKEKQKQWRKSNFKINPESKRNLEKSIKPGNDALHNNKNGGK